MRFYIILLLLLGSLNLKAQTQIPSEQKRDSISYAGFLGKVYNANLFHLKKHQTLRDGNQAAVPPDYLPKDDQTPGFNINKKD